jgi:hypothetical protein
VSQPLLLDPTTFDLQDLDLGERPHEALGLVEDLDEVRAGSGATAATPTVALCRLSW